ncbi:MAG: tyrosine-protein phosphatase [Planctomycetota bacterium]
MRSRRALLWRLFFGSLLIALLIGAVLVWPHQQSPSHLQTVTPGVLYRSGFLRAKNLRKVIDEYGIRTVVDLSTAREKAKDDWDAAGEVRVCRERGIRLIEMPIEDHTPPSPGQLETWLALLDDARARPILVHCDHGVVRTGMLVAVYEMERLGKSNRQALDDMPLFGHSLDKPGREPVSQFILDYVPRK